MAGVVDYSEWGPYSKAALTPKPKADPAAAPMPPPQPAAEPDYPTMGPSLPYMPDFSMFGASMPTMPDAPMMPMGGGDAGGAGGGSTLPSIAALSGLGLPQNTEELGNRLPELNRGLATPDIPASTRALQE